MNAAFVFIGQGLVILILAPLATGLVRFFKARLQGRHGAVPLLPYARLRMLLRKEMVISHSTSWVFHTVPFVVLATSIVLVCVLPLLVVGAVPGFLDNFMFVAALLMLGSVFLVLGGLDVASAFGGMGSSREMTIASLMEPVMLTTLGTFALVSDSAGIHGMLSVGGAGLLAHPALLLSVLALVLVALAENARYPVDNPATHLELTMVHEAMILEYSGAYLAFIEYASSLRLTAFALLIANILLPQTLLAGAGTPLHIALAIAVTILKLGVMMFLLALLESSIPKMRFYRMQEYTAGAFLIALAGFTIALLHFS